MRVSSWASAGSESAGGGRLGEACADRGAQPADEFRSKQAVIETTAGTIVMDLLADRAAESRRALHQDRPRRGLRRDDVPPRCSSRASSRAAIRCRRIQAARGPLWHRRPESAQGGDQRREAYARRGVRGADSGKPDSAGTQFFICIIDQPALDGQLHGLRAGRRRHAGRAENLRGAGRRARAPPSIASS